MGNNEEVLQALKAKNREIYINKLGIDLDKVLETLQITVGNSLDFLSTEVINQLPFLRSEDKGKTINGNTIKDFYRLLKEKLIVSIKDSFEAIASKIHDIDLVDYDEIVNEQKNKIIKELGDFYNNNINEIINKLLMEDKLLDSDRVNNYFINYSYNKLVTHIMSVLTDSFKILCNSHVESYQKFENLNNKTLNSNKTQK